MKVIHIITTINRGGAENHLKDLISTQVEKGYHIKVLYLKGDGYWREEFESKGIEVIGPNIRHYHSILFNRRLRATILRSCPDIIHAHLGPAELYTFFNLLGMNKARLIISKHNDKRFAPIVFGNALMKMVARRAQKVIAISDATREYFIVKGISPSKLKTIHYGIDSNQFTHSRQEDVQSIRRAWKIGEGELLFGTLARLVPQKSLDTMLRAFQLYSSKTSKPAKLVLVGRGPLEKKLKLAVKALNIEKNVIFAGFRTDVPELLNALDVFLLSSIHEGFGLVLIEAMSAGTPIIATRVSAIPEVLGEAGMMVEPKNEEQMAEAMLQMELERQRIMYRRLGLERVKKAFTLEKMFEETHQVYLDAIT